MDEPSAEPLADLAARLDLTWSAIDQARRESAALRQILLAAVQDEVPADTSMVIFGSVARQEYTKGSDIDWALLVDGFADIEHATAEKRIRAIVRKHGASPADNGPFGHLAFSHTLVHAIGGEDDTNSNLTRRMLLLFEAIVIGNGEAYERVIRSVMRRYVEEDYTPSRPGTRRDLPRFLVNDLIRYWHTIGVDFADKRRDQDGKKWAIRHAKLRLSRKLLFAAALVACYGCANVLDPGVQGRMVTEYLLATRRDPPLARLARVLLSYPELDCAAKELFGSYNDFLGLLDQTATREHLEQMDEKERHTSEHFDSVRLLGDRFDAALKMMFVDPAFDTTIYRLTKMYGLF